MIFFVIASLAINVINLVIFLANTLDARRPTPPHTITSAINILLPCRNEAHRVTPTIESLLNQEQLADWQLYILDDRSTDNTKSLINSLISKSVNTTLLSGGEIEVGWIGKSFALHQLYNSARVSEFTILIDADVRLSQRAISQAIGTLESSGLDFMSIYPRQMTKSWSEYLIQPLLQWTWMTSLLLRRSERSSRRSTTVANGQFMVIRTSALTRIEGFSRVQNFVLDDIALARELKKEGFLGTVLNGVDLAECRMYENFTQLSQGYRKSLWSAFGSPIAAFAVGSFFTIAYILPLPLALLQQGWGAALSLLSLAIAIMIRYGVATITGAPRTSSLFHALAILILLALLALSWWDRTRGTLSWSGRSLSGTR